MANPDESVKHHQLIFIAGKNTTWCNHLEKQMGDVSYTAEHSFAIWISHHILWMLTQMNFKTHAQAQPFISLFGAAVKCLSDSYYNLV